ncbi:uncharacterized protein LOC111692125 isoform X2 [Anoplophora glabripennis]|uniref:uncharacterized protein LOC111692125 isoform X2 n=1 Tax=Anoplophora glabripennis TaxID=217634 RepID=UPI000C778A3F|nr:uncharacterized protein LOC111692125 isoform X2 [Anoplophora glabripennis]
MKRVHKYVEAASEIVFIDSSGTMDRDGSRIFVMLTHSECGALPLGLIITTSECVDAIKSGFNIIKELVGEPIFGGHEEGPAVFMTDDSQSEQKAIGDTWPGSKRMLCIFHVLQAVFRWLSKSKNGIPRDEQTSIYRDFQNILYANSLEEATAKYAIAVKNAKLFPKYINYLNNYWWPKRECWVKAYRRGVLMKNNHTNNYSESTIRQIKDKIFSRIKAFNLMQMVDFMLTKFEDYTERKLLDATSNRSSKNLLDKDIKMPPLDLIKLIKKLNENIVAVPSETKPNLLYLVNTEVLICSCTVGSTGAICKHIHWANALFCTDKYINKIDNLKIKENLYLVATGQPSKGEWLLPLIVTLETESSPALTQTNEENRLSFSENTSLPSTSTMDVPIFDPDESRKRYTELLAIMNQCFDKYYEKSPLEVTGSMEKMISTLHKIKTPASFSSAIATFGFAVT